MPNHRNRPTWIQGSVIFFFRIKNFVKLIFKIEVQFFVLFFSRALNESECKLYLIITLSVALTFCVLSAMIVVVACFKKYQESKAIKHAQNLEQEEKEQMARTEVKSVTSSTNSKNNFENQNGGGGVLSIPQHYFNSQSPHLASSSMAPNRPITVRSVKRRDKAKVEEKKMSQQHKIPTVPGRTPDERDAVVV